MSATQELIAAALTACDVAATDYEGAYHAKRDLREACARAMVQPDIAEVERLVEQYARAYVGNRDLQRAALLDYVRGVLAERDALIADNEWLMQIAAQESDVGARVLHEVFALCEDTQDKCSEDANDFTRGRRFEAKGIARSIGTWYQDEFCGRTHMGEPDLTADQFRDAAKMVSAAHVGDANKMVPAAWQVWCGLGKMQPYWPVFRKKEEAEECAKTIKTYTEVRPLWSHASPAPQPVGEVPMPEPDGSAESDIKPLPGGGYQHGIVDAWSEPLMRTYGAAREAAGYAQGLKEAEAKITSSLAATVECNMFETVIYPTIDAALRGEVRP